jgi:O-succinylbenzoic acid--CoA ligase
VDWALAAGLPIALTYGLTEATSQVATASPAEVRSDPDSVGRPLEGVDVRISADGEILVRGPTVAPGLWGGGTLTDEGGWLATGDLGSLDGQGRLRVTGRRSDRIVSGGATVDAHEVEAVLRTHPSISDACVVGIPDPTWGQRVTAAVVGVPGHAVDPDVLREWLRPRLSPAKRPKRIHAVAALPLNPNGKVDRAAVRRLVDRSESNLPG